jgi:hypothetical protein
MVADAKAGRDGHVLVAADAVLDGFGAFSSIDLF